MEPLHYLGKVPYSKDSNYQDFCRPTGFVNTTHSQLHRLMMEQMEWAVANRTRLWEYDNPLKEWYYSYQRENGDRVHLRFDRVMKENTRTMLWVSTPLWSGYLGFVKVYYDWWRGQPETVRSLYDLEACQLLEKAYPELLHKAVQLADHTQHRALGVRRFYY